MAHGRRFLGNLSLFIKLFLLVFLLKVLQDVHSYIIQLKEIYGSFSPFLNYFQVDSNIIENIISWLSFSQPVLILILFIFLFLIVIVLDLYLAVETEYGSLLWNQDHHTSTLIKSSLVECRVDMEVNLVRETC